MKITKAGGKLAHQGVSRNTESEGPVKLAGVAAVHEQEFAEALSAFSLRQVEGELEEVIAALDIIGQRLVHDRSRDNLVEFTSLVRGFAERVVSALYTVEQFEAHPRSQKDKALMRVKKLNTELEELAEDVLNRNKDALTIAERYKMIRGLLVDIFAE